MLPEAGGVQGRRPAGAAARTRFGAWMERRRGQWASPLLVLLLVVVEKLFVVLVQLRIEVFVVALEILVLEVLVFEVLVVARGLLRRRNQGFFIDVRSGQF